MIFWVADPPVRETRTHIYYYICTFVVVEEKKRTHVAFKGGLDIIK